MPKSKKDIADKSIMETNDSSIASKRSVETLYSRPGEVEFFKHFVPKPQRRSPVINRGYWTRMKAMGFFIERFAAEEFDGKKVVVNLGCGFDPYAFDYLNKQQDLIFVDVDYPELMQKKADVVMSTPELSSILGNVKRGKDHVHLQSDNYYAVSCDLRDLNRFTTILNSLFEQETSYLFTAEVSITYMTQQCADDLIKWAATMPNAHFSLLEQMMPAGETHPFAKRMLNHFKSYGSPLNCIEAYPTLKHQIARFESRGWGVQTAKDLYRFWKENVPQQDKDFVESVEQFDEHEEFVLFGQHYFILHAVNTMETHRKLRSKRSRTLEQPKIVVTAEPTELKVKLGAGTTYKDQPVVHGGMYMSRRADLVNLTADPICQPPNLKPRVCHTITELSNGNLLLVGGREGPARLLSDCWMFSTDGEWTQCHDLPQPRYRHCAVALPNNRVLVYGGSAENTNASSFLIWSQNDGWVELESNLEPRFSAALGWDASRNIGVLVGGMHNHTVQRDAYHVILHEEDNEVRCVQVADDALLERYSAQLTVLDDEEHSVLIVGGVSEHELFNKDNTLIKLEPSGSITPLSIKIETQPMWCSFSMQGLTTFGGGAACYGFGSHWDSAHHIQL